MDNNLIVYLERLELLAFFGGYPFIYALVLAFRPKHSRRGTFAESLFRQLPLAYALTGLLFLGYLLKNLYPDYSISNITLQLSWLKIWGLLSLLFWLKPFNQKTIFSLLHSFVFFFFLLQDFFMYLFSRKSADVITNDMRVYFDSILLNSGTLLVISIIYFFLKKFRKTV